MPKNAITDDGEMGQMLYNISKLYHRWAKKEGISKKSMSRYWHGETEDFISVKNNLRVREILKFSKEVYYERKRTIKTNDLNIFLTFN